MLGKDRTVIFGAGNVLLGDEGVGVHVARALANIDLPPNVEVIDGGTYSDYLSSLGPVDRLIIVDAVLAGGRPGSVYRLAAADLAQPQDILSLHDAGVLSSLKMMSLLGNEPRQTVILGVQPAVISWGMELSEELQHRMPDILNAVLKEVSGGG